MTRRVLPVALFAFAFVVPGCIGGDDRIEEEAVAAVEGFDPARPDSMDRLNQVVARGGDVISVLEPFVAGPDPIRTWAALYVVALLADSESDADVLAPLLLDPDPANRVIAAGSLAGLGRKDALPVLIQGLGAEAALPYTDPPRSAADLAAEALVAYTAESFATPEAWRSWWDGVGERLRWDGERYVLD